MQNGYYRFCAEYLQKNTYSSLRMCNQWISITIHFAETNQPTLTVQIITAVTIHDLQ
ncbi:conserved protein of unknown function [Enterobacter cancerogenus]|nr:conserved protein of unknown function [Enterobacter cancerogenus]